MTLCANLTTGLATPQKSCSTFSAHLHAPRLSWGGAPLFLGWAWGCRSLPGLWCYRWYSIQQFCSSEAWDQWYAWIAELSESKTSLPALRSKTTLPMGILTNRLSIFKIPTLLAFPLTLPQKAPGEKWVWLVPPPRFSWSIHRLPSDLVSTRSLSRLLGDWKSNVSPLPCGVTIPLWLWMVNYLKKGYFSFPVFPEQFLLN